jgi:PEGA domain
MDELREVQPLSYTKRRRTFFFLLALFVISLPFLYLYATGYRFDFRDPNALVGTGGIYVAAERTGAEIYIDDELVRETRVFRTAFYAQNLEPKTHRVHVQKEGHHTWVKELPVLSHRVTEAQAFNMPLVPQLRVVSEYTSATGSPIVRTPLIGSASTTNIVLATTTKATTTFAINPEYQTLVIHFESTSTAPAAKPLIQRIEDEFVGTTTEPVPSATTTRESGDVRLSQGSAGELYAEWIGPFERMPYYYCAAPFPRYSTTTEGESAPVAATPGPDNAALAKLGEAEQAEFIHPVQELEEDVVCDRRIPIEAPSDILGFEFFPGSTDFVMLELAQGIFVIEIDNRAWQNLQPLVLGDALRVHVENGSTYVYDGVLIYQVILDQ